MSITIATIGSALVTGVTHPLTTFGLLSANTIMNGFELKNQSDMKAGIARCEAGVKSACEKLDELQEMADATVTYADMKKLLTEPAPAPAPTQPQGQPQGQPQTESIPGWAREMFSQQQGLSAAVAELMKNQQQAPVQNVTVSNPAPAPTPTAPAPAAPTPATTAPASAPATSQDDLMAAILTTMKQAFREGLAEGFAEGFGKATGTPTPTTPAAPAPTTPAAPEAPAPTGKG
jgi:hypothetical protein